MPSDFELLGLEATEDRSAIRSAYRRRMKELHPDLSGGDDSFGRHALLVGVNGAYRRLMGRAAPGPARSAPPPPESATSEPHTFGLPVPHADPAYAYYKTAVDCQRRIHPSAWNFEKSGMLAIKISDDDAAQELMRRKVADLVKLFPKAYFYFSVVANEYPDSVWAADAREKMAQIEKMTRRYRKIIESFSQWNDDRASRAKAHREMLRRQAETRAAVSPETERRWKTT